MPKFYCDINVNRLARWLRFAGFDTMCKKELSINKIQTICQKERRIFITRNKKIKNYSGKIEIIESEILIEQIDTILNKYKITNDLIASRCMSCNVILKNSNEEGKKYCPRCGKYFWKGSHFRDMLLVLDKYVF